MDADRFRRVTGRYRSLRVAVVGDFFLDRYLLIDPSIADVSIETGLPVHAVGEVRPQPGAAGTIVNNLVALGVGEVRVVGFRGDDGEGYELRRALDALAGVDASDLIVATDRRTPVYCKPTVVEPGCPPRELSRLDSKNRTPTPEALSIDLAARLTRIGGSVDAILLMDQVDLPETGVVTRAVREAASAIGLGPDRVLVMADSRRGLGGFPPMTFKMNAAELAAMTGGAGDSIEAIMGRSSDLARTVDRPVFVTLADRGIVCGSPDGDPVHVPAHPVGGPIDVVGAGDAVGSNLAAAIAAGASTVEAMEIAMAAASIVVHKLGTTGTAAVVEVAARLGLDPGSAQ